MSRERIERQLVEVSRRLREAREELAALDEQMDVVQDDVDSARVRALVADSPETRRDSDEMAKTAAALTRGRDDVVAAIARLQGEQTELLDKLPPLDDPLHPPDP